MQGITVREQRLPDNSSVYNVEFHDNDHEMVIECETERQAWTVKLFLDSYALHAYIR
jgi:hypothetical protein